MDSSNSQAAGFKATNSRRKTTQTDSSNPRFFNTGKPWSDSENAALLRSRIGPSPCTYERMEPIFGRTLLALRLQVLKLDRAARKRRARRDSVISHESTSSREATPETSRRKSPTIKINPRKAWAAINASPARPPI